ncbi:MAG: UDP-N-acetylmuramoyl-L-alanyl-D-glutamate--2,6-diaminopimelate ligase [Bacillota bacterium]|nr:UDP-N-acetylmuramoyl-L-alanyl-D-glutamate--2,6-diaminopimelate ligase [Bacillota bacterium]
MKLQEITSLFGLECREDKEITAVVYDSRKVSTGSLFVCIPGGTMDGHDFAAAAVSQGAAALVVERYLEDISPEIPQLKVENARLALAKIAEAYYRYPGKELRILGITGTNGKTTTTHLLKEILDAYGAEAGLIGTNHILIGDKVIPATGTTPESLEISVYLRDMVTAGCEYAVMEVSSHGLKQGRVSALDFNGAAFTNLTQDHLDYHHDFEDYISSKELLFRSLQEPAYAVVNIDDYYSHRFLEATSVRTITCGLRPEADYYAKDIAIEQNGTSFTLLRRGEKFKVHIPLLGNFNVYNVLTAIAMLEAEGLPLDFILASLTKVKQVRGRFEKVRADAGPTVVVDYAHSPDGLKNILNTANSMKKGRLILVFGCGGDRDKAKRPIMGRIGGEMADIPIITSDNPRTEEPASIVAMIEEGVKESGCNYLVEVDRRTAINMAIEMADEDDLVVIAGKGHEDYQIIGREKIHFDDFEEAEKALLAKSNNKK